MREFNYPSQETLLLMYNVKCRYEAVYISEFFKLYGFFVVEQEIIEDQMWSESQIEASEMYKYVVSLEGKQSEFARILNNGNSGFINVQADPDFDSNHARNRYEILSQNLLRIVRRVFNSDDSILNEMVECYVQGEYCRYSHIKRYFVSEISEGERTLLRNRLSQIYERLDTISEWAMDEWYYYVMYAKLLVARRVNDICQVMKINPWFYPDRLINSCMELVRFEPIAAATYALVASYFQCDASYRASVIPYYERALWNYEKHPAFAHIYYRMGLYYEKRQEDKEQAYKVYGKGFAVAPGYYRILFKMAIKFYDERKFRSALVVFKSLIASLQDKYNNNVLMPIEYEYLCKCYLLIGLIYSYYWDEREEGEAYNQRALELVENEMSKTRFFEDFLGKQIFCDYLKERIALRKHGLVGK